MKHRTDRYQLIEQALAEPLADFVAKRRRVDAPPFRPATGWRDIASEITQRTGIAVTGEALRLWFGAQQPEPVNGVTR